MKAGVFAAATAAAGLIALSAPAGACPNGYEAAWIQGNKVCRIKTPNLNLKAKTKRELKKAATIKSGR
jgi:hypothetical protein